MKTTQTETMQETVLSNVPVFHLGTHLEEGTIPALKKGVWVFTNSHGVRVAFTEELVMAIADIMVTRFDADTDEIVRQLHENGGLS